MAGIRRVSAVESILGKTKEAVKAAANAVAEDVKEHKGAYVAAAGVAATAGGIAHILNKDEVKLGHYQMVGYETDENGLPIYSSMGFVPRYEWTDDPTFFQKLQLKIREVLKFDPNKVPKGIDPSNPYMSDKAGHYIMDEYGVIPNPWYNPDLAKDSVEKIGSATQSLGFKKVSIDEFIANAAAKSHSSDAAFTGIDVVKEAGGGIVSSAGDVFTPNSSEAVIDAVTGDDSFIEHSASVIKHIFDSLL